jgi:hypothetical protein
MLMSSTFLAVAQTTQDIEETERQGSYRRQHSAHSKCASSPSVPASTSQTVDPLAVVRIRTASDNLQADEAPFPVTAVMFVDGALPHPGCGRESVPTGLAEQIGVRG